MWDAVFIAVVIAAVLGLAVKYAAGYVSRNKFTFNDFHISWGELIGVVVAMSLVIAPVLGLISSKVAVANKLEREEFINSVETDAYPIRTVCEEGHSGSSESAGKSNCDQTYVSGSYSWRESYSCTDSEGEPDICYRWESANIYTPYATVEFEYVIEYIDVIEETERHVTVASGVLETNPTPFYDDVSIPGSLPRGAPAFWQEARDRLDAGDPRANTVIRKYENPIIASENALLKEFDGDVQRYLDEGLLPLHTRNLLDNPIHDFYLADKAAFIGDDGEFIPKDDDVWQSALMRFNAALGMSLQGDMHALFVPADLVSNPNNYVTAYKAYATSPAMGKRQIAKNSIIVVMGVKNGTVQWAAAETGMPYGNETMLRAIELRLPGTPYDPEAIFGDPRTKVWLDKNSEVQYEVTHSYPYGVLEQIVFKDFVFERACMDCEDKEEAGEVGYTYLRAEIEPSTTSKVVMVVISSVIALILWWLAAYLPVGEIARDFISQWRSRNHRNNYSW